MVTFENVEKLRERANVTYEEAKEALDACGDNLLDAMIYLENKGKVSPPRAGGSYSSADGGGATTQEAYGANAQAQPDDESFGQLTRRFGRFLRGLIYKGLRNTFEVRRHGDMMFSVPVLLLVILLIIGFWIVFPLIVVGLFFGFRYRFTGRDFEKTSVNKVMDSAASAAENFKEEMRTPEDKPKE